MSHLQGAYTYSGSSIASTLSQSSQSRYSKDTSPTDHSHPSIGPCGAGRVETDSKLLYSDKLYSSASSVGTYASTLPSQDALAEHVPNYEVEAESFDQYFSDVLPASPKDFAELFPSTRRLNIRHDDSTVDGNMNLRIDTTVCGPSARPHKLQLFHLRLRDLKTRDFSFRRYCRDSNREVCNSSRKPQKPAAFKRSLSGAIGLFKSKPDLKTQPALQRQDSGYDSMDEYLDESEEAKPSTTKLLDDVMSLEFSNYAHVDLRRRSQTKKRYDFEYWGTAYTWQRHVSKTAGSQSVSFTLAKRGSSCTLAHVAPNDLTRQEADDEAEKGGWIPPSSLWISDQQIIDGPADACDAIVATGLIAMVDDCIRRRFHARGTRQLVIPMPSLPSLKANKEHVDPDSLVDETFNRPGKHASTLR